MHVCVSVVLLLGAKENKSGRNGVTA